MYPLRLKRNITVNSLAQIGAKLFSKNKVFFYALLLPLLIHCQIIDTIIPPIHNSRHVGAFVWSDTDNIYERQGYSFNLPFEGNNYLIKRNKKSLQVEQIVELGKTYFNPPDTNYFISGTNFFGEKKFLFCERYDSSGINYYIVNLNSDTLSDFSDSVGVNKALYENEFHGIFGIKKLSSNLIAIFGDNISSLDAPFQRLNSFIILVDTNYNVIKREKYFQKHSTDFCAMQITDIVLIDSNTLFVNFHYCFAKLNLDTLNTQVTHKVPVKFFNIYKLSNEKLLMGGIIKYQPTDSFYSSSGWSRFGFGIVDTSLQISDTISYLTVEKYNTSFPGHRDWSSQNTESNTLCFKDSNNLVFGSGYFHKENQFSPTTYGIEFVKSDIQGNIDWRYKWESPNSTNTGTQIVSVLCGEDNTYAYILFGDLSVRAIALFVFGPNGNLNTIDYDQNNPNIKAYPNPGSAYFNLQLPFELQGQKLTLALNNSQGQKVLEQEYIGSEVSTEHLPAGVYFYSLFDTNGKLLKIDKWVKK